MLAKKTQFAKRQYGFENIHSQIRIKGLYCKERALLQRDNTNLKICMANERALLRKDNIEYRDTHLRLDIEYRDMQLLYRI